MKRIKVLLFGLTPFLFGGIFKWLLNIFKGDFPVFLTGIIVLFLWALIAYAGRKYVTTSFQAVILLNTPALVVLIIIGVLDLVLYSDRFIYWFYLPFLHFGSHLTSWCDSLYSAFIAAFLLMIGVSALGCRWYQKNNL